MASPMEYAVEIEDLSVTLGNFKALQNVSFKVRPGEFVAIIGPNGAGKSTLIKAILGLLPHYEGKVRVFGRDVRESDVEWIGYVPQLKTIDRSFPAITCDLVASGMKGRWPARLTKQTHKRVNAALELVGARHLCHKSLGVLSGGEIQRVYLARAMVRQPRLLLLDEPATGIDMVGEDDMYTYLENYLEKAKATIMAVTHDPLAARHHADNVLLINRRLICFGPPEEALDDEHLRDAFGHLGHLHPLERAKGND